MANNSAMFMGNTAAVAQGSRKCYVNSISCSNQFPLEWAVCTKSAAIIALGANFHHKYFSLQIKKSIHSINQLLRAMLSTAHLSIKSKKIIQQSTSKRTRAGFRVLCSLGLCV